MRRAALLLGAALVLAGAARAHELGAGRVEVFLARDGGFRVDLQLDPDLTLQRLQLAAGEALTPGLAEAPLRAALLARREALLATAAVTAAGAPLPTSFEYVPVPPAANGRREAVVRLAGRLPASAADLRLAWSLPASRYALVVHREGETGDLETHWVEPGEAGPPLRRAEIGRAHV